MSETKLWHVISLGAGVQSSTMALMAAHGEITPMPDAAIFADTQDEPASVYRWLDWLEKQLPFPVHRVTRGQLAQSALAQRVSVKTGKTFSLVDIPWYTKSPTGEQGMIRNRKCTSEFKIQPIARALRLLCGIKRGQKTISVISWLGISLDEVRRMKESREAWIFHRWPLIERRITRRHCLEWMREHGYPEPPRSACVYCPFRSNKEWRKMKNNEPEEFARAVEFEKKLQNTRLGTHTFTPFLHRSCVPLDQIDFRNQEDHGQLSLWDDECEGMCGV